MKRIVLRTQRHKALLKEWAKTKGRRVWVRDVMALLAEAAMNDNAIYRHAPKMRELARRMCDAPLYKEEIIRLRRFLRDAQCLHIDGYIRFCMGWYAQTLDFLSYRLIKKLRARVRGD